MSNGEGVQITGLRQVVRGLERAGVEVDDLKDAFAKIADLGAAAVKRHAPKGRTGRLAASVRGNRAKSKAVVAAGRKAVPYAGPINYGWRRRNIAASRFMQKADDEIKPLVVPTLEAELQSLLRRNRLL